MRPDWDSYYLSMAKLVSERSTCPKIAVGVVLVNNNRVIATGYNGSPSGMQHCDDVGCIDYNDHCIRSLHAETNAILQCAENGVSTKGSTLYTTTFPCWNCALMLINAGVKRIVYLEDYEDDRGDQYEMLILSDVSIKKLY